MKLLVLSDIHANLTAFDAVMAHAEKNYGSDLCVAHLGDVVDYGMRPNETLERLNMLEMALIVNLAGNHERVILGSDVERLSSARGVAACVFTRQILDRQWLDYFSSVMTHAPFSMELCGRRILFVHGDYGDPFWGHMPDGEMAKEVYREFDFVISGHTHIPVLKERFYPDGSAKARRGKKKTVFVNPGSVGQPRNHNPAAHYGVLDIQTGSIHLNAVPYDVEKEVVLYRGEVDPFYGERLEVGV